MTTPVTHVHSHHREPAGSASRTTSTITRATAQPAVTTIVTSRSSASLGGGAWCCSPGLTCRCSLTHQG